jgi:hypothetical protein
MDTRQGHMNGGMTRMANVVRSNSLRSSPQPPSAVLRRERQAPPQLPPVPEQQYPQQGGYPQQHQYPVPQGYSPRHVVPMGAMSNRSSTGSDHFQQQTRPPYAGHNMQPPYTGNPMQPQQQAYR